MTVYRAVTQISLNWPLELATSGGEITCTNSNNVTQLIKHLIRSAWPCPQVTYPDHDRYILLFPHYRTLSFHLGTIIPYPSHEP